MERNIIQWNLVNWITVFLMAVIGYTLFSAGYTFVSSKIGEGS